MNWDSKEVRGIQKEKGFYTLFHDGKRYLIKQIASESFFGVFIENKTSVFPILRNKLRENDYQ